MFALKIKNPSSVTSGDTKALFPRDCPRDAQRALLPVPPPLGCSAQGPSATSSSSQCHTATVTSSGSAHPSTYPRLSLPSSAATEQLPQSPENANSLYRERSGFKPRLQVLGQSGLGGTQRAGTAGTHGWHRQQYRRHGMEPRVPSAGQTQQRRGRDQPALSSLLLPPHGAEARQELLPKRESTCGARSQKYL